MRSRTVVLVIPNVNNPAALVWAAGIAQAGYDLILYDLSLEIQPDGLGRADVLVHWWGIEGLTRWPATLARLALDVPVVLCVDTFPNAAFSHSARRERRAGLAAVPPPSGLICYSDAMEAMLKNAIPAWRGVPSISLPIPLLDEMLCRCAGCVNPGSASDSFMPSDGLVFQGRADLLFSRDPRMRKDQLGPILKKTVSRGVSVTVQDGCPRANAPFGTYLRYTNEEMMDGTFSTFLSGFDAQLAIYREPNLTIRHRVANGLSTRFGFGLASCSPIIVSSSARFALRDPYAPFTMSVRPDLSDIDAVVADKARLAEARSEHRSYLRQHRWSHSSGILESVLG